MDETLAWLIGGGTLLTVIIAVVCSIIPFVAIFGGLFYFLRKRGQQMQSLNLASQTWPSTTGTVVKSRVEVSGGEHTSVSPRVVYEYEVRGTKYQSDRIKAGDSLMRVQTGGSRTAYDTVDRYPEGKTVTVYYNPDNPAESALER